MQAKNDLTREQVERLIAYDPKTGMFTWKRFRGSANSGNNGKAAGEISVGGYRRIVLSGRRYMASRLAWLLVTGNWPEEQIDHFNCDRADDRFVNLRECTQSENMSNCRKGKGNTTGFKGVSFVASQNGPNKYKAEIKKDGESHFLGWFPDAQSAAYARNGAAAILHGEFARNE